MTNVKLNDDIRNDLIGYLGEMSFSVQDHRSFIRARKDNCILNITGDSILVYRKVTDKTIVTHSVAGIKEFTFQDYAIQLHLFGVVKFQEVRKKRNQCHSLQKAVV